MVGYYDGKGPAVTLSSASKLFHAVSCPKGQLAPRRPPKPWQGSPPQTGQSHSFAAVDPSALGLPVQLQVLLSSNIYTAAPTECHISFIQNSQRHGDIFHSGIMVEHHLEKSQNGQDTRTCAAHPPARRASRTAPSPIASTLLKTYRHAAAFPRRCLER